MQAWFAISSLQRTTYRSDAVAVGRISVEAAPVAAVAKHDGKSCYTMYEVQVGREDLGMVEIKNASELRGKQIVAAGANHLIGVLANQPE